MYEAFSEGLKFVVFKSDKIASKNSNEEEHRQSKNEELKSLKELFFSCNKRSSSLKRGVILLSNKVLLEIFFGLPP